MEGAEHLGGLDIAFRLGMVFLLVFANGFMVAAEFALVGARRSRIEQMAADGVAGARTVESALQHIDRYISATQLGITLASLGLGWIGEPALAALVDLLFASLGMPLSQGAAHSVAAIVTAFSIITFLHIVLGELAPKSMALIAPEKVSIAVTRPLMIFAWVMSPGIWVLNGTANALLRLFGIQPATEASRVHSPEELRLLVVQSRDHGALESTPSEFIAGVFDFQEKRARDVMRPRTEVVAIPFEASEEEVWTLMRRERYSRYPVYRESMDDVEGVFLAKDLWLAEKGKPFVFADLVRPALYIPDSRLAGRVYDDLRRTRAHMAVVLDEYGGTAGIITMEDLIEEVMGDIADEYDIATRTSIETDGVLELAGSLSLIDVRSDYRLRIPEGEWTTLGGYAFSRLGRLPKIGDRVSFPGGELEVVAMDGRRVAGLRVHRVAAESGAGAARGNGGGRGA
ncbi:MAG: hemolysin family protein [Gemmatimonadaceae bacterium]